MSHDKEQDEIAPPDEAKAPHLDETAEGNDNSAGDGLCEVKAFQPLGEAGRPVLLGLGLIVCALVLWMGFRPTASVKGASIKPSSMSATVQPLDVPHARVPQHGPVSLTRPTRPKSNPSPSALAKQRLTHAKIKQQLAQQQANMTLYAQASPEPAAQAQAEEGPTIATALTLTHPDFVLAEGEMVPAILETAMTSTFEGRVRAIISQPVYAYTGTQPLLPAGSRLLGTYQQAGSITQRRVFVVWDRVILPNGVTAQLGSPSVDTLGRTGQSADKVNTHFLARFGEASLLSMIGIGAQTAGVNTRENDNSLSDYRTSLGRNFGQSANASFKARVNLQPTLQVNQGTRLQVFVAKDIDFYEALHDNAAK